MPANATVSIRSDAWTQLTANDITAATFQNVGPAEVRIMATVGAVAPGALDGGIYMPGQGERSTVTLAQLFPSVVGGNRLWARALALPTSVWINHA